MEKKGSHVGIVLSFIIFVTFLVFLYTLLQPSIKLDEDKQGILDDLKEELIKNFSIEVNTLIVSPMEGTEFDNGENCFILSSSDLESAKVFGEGFIIKDVDEKIVNGGVSGSDLKFDWPVAEKNVSKIYFSEYFEDENYEGDCENNNDVEIDLVRKNEYVYEELLTEKINEIKEYGQEYNNFKEYLGVPVGTDFSMVFINSEDEEISMEEKTTSESVFAEEVPISYINSTASLKHGFLRIKVW